MGAAAPNKKAYYKLMNISKKDTIERSGNVAQRLFEEQMLVINPKDSLLHRFNEVGTFIWQILETPKTVEEICAEVKEHFKDADEDRVFLDVTGFISKLEEKKLVRILL